MYKYALTCLQQRVDLYANDLGGVRLKPLYGSKKYLYISCTDNVLIMYTPNLNMNC